MSMITMLNNHNACEDFDTVARMSLKLTNYHNPCHAESEGSWVLGKLFSSSLLDT